MSRYCIIVNPISGRGAGEKAIPFIDQKLRAEGLDFEITCTQRPWHAADLAREAVSAGCEFIVAAGGDGTARSASRC